MPNVPKLSHNTTDTWEVLKSVIKYKGITTFTWFVFDVAVTNSFILMSNYTSNSERSANYTIKQFRVDLAKELIGDYNSRNRRGRTPSPSSPTSHNVQQLLQHFPMKQRVATKRGISRCWLCMNKQKCKETYWYCQECKIHLCHTGAPDTDYFYTNIIVTCFKTCFRIYLCFLIM